MRISFGWMLRNQLKWSVKIIKDKKGRGKKEKYLNLRRKMGESGNKFLGNRKRISDRYFPGDDRVRSMRKIEHRRGCVFAALLELHVQVFDVILRRHRTLISDINLDSRFPRRSFFLALPVRLTRFSVLLVHQTFTFHYFHRTFSTLHAELMVIVRLSLKTADIKRIIIYVPGNIVGFGSIQLTVFYYWEFP